MRKWLVTFVLCIVVGAATVGVFFLTQNTRRLTWEDYDRLEAGKGTMSETDVVIALGRPPDGDIEVRCGADEVDFVQGRYGQAAYGKIWKQDGFAIEVIFDAQHKVVDIDFSGSAPPESLLIRIRRWLRL